MKPGCAIVLATALAVCCGTPVASSEIKVLTAREGRVVIQILGQIEPGDGDLFITTVKQANTAGKAIEGILLNSTGGRPVRQRSGSGGSTSVSPGAVCASPVFWRLPPAIQSLSAKVR
jgi:hypothetical protein